MDSNKEIQVLENILEKYVRPKLWEHGGNVEIDAVRNKTLYIKLRGHCSGCPAAKYTLESLIKEEILNHTRMIEDIRLSEEVSPELYDFARQLLAGKISVYADRD